jgi:hypothetical protein
MPYIGKKPENIIATAVDSTTGDFSGNVTTGGTHTVTGASILNGGIDVAGDFNFDVGGGDITLKDDGTSVANIGMELGSFILNAPTSDTDIIFKGNDGGSAITALTLDMSAAGAASFNGAVTANAGVVVDNITIDGTEIDLSSGDLTIDVAGDIILDADGGDVSFRDDGTGFLAITNSSNDAVIHSVQNDKDMIFTGTDGGNSVTALTLDMSAAGTAIFNHDVLVGTTDTSGGTSTHVTEGIALSAGSFGGFIGASRSGDKVASFNRNSSDGTIVDFRQGGTEGGSIGIKTAAAFFVGTAHGLIMHTGDVRPCTNTGANDDDSLDLGASFARFDDLFATNGTIQTSDRNEKQDIEELNDAEKRVAVVAKGLMRKFRWKSKVAEKGDKARTHFGIIAQDLQDAFTAESLDASKYAMFCSDTWWEKEISVDAVEADNEKGIEAKDAYTYTDTKQEATTGYTEKTRLGVRYSELLAFIISAI